MEATIGVRVFHPEGTRIFACCSFPTALAPHPGTAFAEAVSHCPWARDSAMIFLEE